MRPPAHFTLVAALGLLLLPAAAIGQPAQPQPPPAEQPPGTAAPAPEAPPEEPPPEEPPPEEPPPEEDTSQQEEDDALAAELGLAPSVTTGIVGQVIDAISKEPVIEAPVIVLERNERVLTDIDGNYAIELRPGTYTLRSYYDLYLPARVENVTVVRGRATRIVIELQPETDAAVIEVEVRDRADTTRESTQLQIRRQSAGVSDAVSAQEIARSPDSTASESARRVVAATIVDGQYLYVRGLGGRYTGVQLNGVTLPSLDPDYPGVQLDLFPASLLTSMTVIKTFTPELSGEFAGGLMIINTRDYPPAFTLSANASMGVNPSVTGGTVLDYDGGGSDFLGYDDGARSLPQEVPAARVTGGRTGLPPEQIETIAESFPATWDLHRRTAPPNFGFGVSVGNAAQLGSHPLGYILSLGYSNNTSRTDETTRKVNIQGLEGEEELIQTEEMDVENYKNDVLWGSLGTLSFGISDDHELTLVALHNQSATDSTGFTQGISNTESVPIRQRRLRWVERTLDFAQLLGDHRHLPLDARIRWQLNGSLAERTEPDRRDLMQIEGLLNGEPAFQWRDTTGSGERFYSDLDSDSYGGGLDVTTPAGPVTTKVGWMARIENRSFLSRRFVYATGRGLVAEDLYLPPEQLFSPDFIGDGITFSELTAASDGYDSQQRLYASFAQVDTPFPYVARLRAIGGIRAEAYAQRIESASPFADADETEEGTRRTDLDLLPAAGVVYQVTDDIYARAAYGATVARPQIRELSPFLYADFARRRTVQGNPDLRRTYIHNFDHRWEWYPTESEVLAASLFYKDFVDPIEQVLVDQNSNISYDNARSATNYGAELEVRLGLDRIANPLRAFSVGSNLTLIVSEVKLSREQSETATNLERPLAGQSPYVANLSLGFSPPDSKVSLFAYYNVFGRRIEDVGILGLPDVYQEPFHSVDMTASWEPIEHFSLKLSGKNLLDSQVVLTQGPIEVRTYRPGPSFSLRVGWTY